MKNQISIFGCLFLLIWLLPSCSSSKGQEVISNPVFEKKIISPDFISEGIAIGDVNQDGQKDLLAGPYWFEAPNWEKHEIFEPKYFDPKKEWSNSFLNFASDINEDGWIDFVRIDFPGQGAYWYENPKNQTGHWIERLIDSTACNESPMMYDLNQDGKEDLIFGKEATGEMIWFQSQKHADSILWTKTAISKPKSPATGRFSHGLGAADMNQDGRLDVLTRHGWWEAPEKISKTPWVFHKASLGAPCSQMYSYDFDQDGDQDVISASAHNYGIWWHENRSDIKQDSFTIHPIDSSFSQSHATQLLDLNGDQLPDFITGKRYFGHNGKDPGGFEAAVLYWYEMRRDKKSRPFWQPHLIDQDSGVGLQVLVEDLNNDGKLDLINANKKGVIVFYQQ